MLQNTVTVAISFTVRVFKQLSFIMNTIEFEPKYKVTYPHDEMDWKNPTVKYFAFHHEMEDWLHEEVQRRVDFIVQHSFDTVSEEELKEIEEYEWYLVKVEEV